MSKEKVLEELNAIERKIFFMEMKDYHTLSDRDYLFELHQKEKTLKELLKSFEK